MLRIFFALTASLLGIAAFANAADSLTVSVNQGFESPELKRLSRFQGIEQIRMKFAGQPTKGCEFRLSFEVYDSGKVTSKGSLNAGLPPMLFQAKSDTFELHCLSQAIADSVKINFFFPRFNTSTFFSLRGAGNAYSMRVASQFDGAENAKLPADSSKQPVLVYSLPYQRADAPGQSFYCELTREGVPPSQWWEKFKVPHYIVFYVRVNKPARA